MIKKMKYLQKYYIEDNLNYMVDKSYLLMKISDQNLVIINYRIDSDCGLHALAIYYNANSNL